MNEVAASGQRCYTQCKESLVASACGPPPADSCSLAPAVGGSESPPHYVSCHKLCANRGGRPRNSGRASAGPFRETSAGCGSSHIILQHKQRGLGVRATIPASSTSTRGPSSVCQSKLIVAHKAGSVTFQPMNLSCRTWCFVQCWSVFS